MTEDKIKKEIAKEAKETIARVDIASIEIDEALRNSKLNLNMLERTMAIIKEYWIHKGTLYSSWENLVTQGSMTREDINKSKEFLEGYDDIIKKQVNNAAQTALFSKILDVYNNSPEQKKVELAIF
jgi:hypothetical protein